MRDVNDLMTNIQLNVQTIIDKVQHYLSKLVDGNQLKFYLFAKWCNKTIFVFFFVIFRWNEYQDLWKSDKIMICENFVNRGLPLVYIDEKFLFYTNIVDSMDTIEVYHDIGPIRINLQSLIRQIRSYALDWKSTLGDILMKRTLLILRALQKHITVCTDSVVCYYALDVC